MSREEVSLLADTSNNKLIWSLFSIEERRKSHMNQRLTDLEDNALIALALDGETECFSILVNRHLTAVKRCIGAMVRNGMDVDDLLQDVLLKVWRRLATFRSESSFRTWMTRVAINEVLQTYRRDKRHAICQTFENLDGLPSLCESPHTSLVRIEATKVLRNAVAGLPERYREVVILRDLEQFTTEETAQSLRSSVPAVKTRLFRARLMLSGALQESRKRGLPVSGRKTPIRMAA